MHRNVASCQQEGQRLDLAVSFFLWIKLQSFQTIQPLDIFPGADEACDGDMMLLIPKDRLIDCQIVRLQIVRFRVQVHADVDAHYIWAGKAAQGKSINPNENERLLFICKKDVSTCKQMGKGLPLSKLVSSLSAICNIEQTTFYRSFDW